MWRANVAVLVETVVGGHIDHIVPADVTGLGLARCEGSCDRGSQPARLCHVTCNTVVKMNSHMGDKGSSHESSRLWHKNIMIKLRTANVIIFKAKSA